LLIARRGWKAPALYVLAPTGALVEIATPHLVGGRLCFEVASAGKTLELRSPTMRALAASRRKRRDFNEGGLAYGEMT